MEFYASSREGSINSKGKVLGLVPTSGLSHLQGGKWVLMPPERDALPLLGALRAVLPNHVQAPLGHKGSTAVPSQEQPTPLGLTHVSGIRMASLCHL